ncbi:uncharacterized protein LOC126298277 [Schistocerca gregaria]|uniref:uncharacterized protein LOC126298277 n=1 Tax=Schistocerca gregaria TaxID=7010 RepID=UPI00211DF357|nr:uncharacterized protein LOC126298277 [Schistocerca gregaria]
MEPLTYVVITSLSTGAFPSSLKMGKFFSNERVSNNRLDSYIAKKLILSANQHGFSKSKCTLTAMYEYLEAHCKELDDKESATGIFLDLSKAFDIIDHDFHIHKLPQKHVSAIPNQNIITTTRHPCSKSLIKYGVSQGSILGSQLFLLYTEDLNEFIITKKIFAYNTRNLITVSDKISMKVAIDTSVTLVTSQSQKLRYNK